MNLTQWLHLRTFHHSQFADIKALLQKKKEHHLSISLCLPTLNEEPTIGKILRILKKELHDRYPLLDEIMVIDSGSTDRTVEIARKAGVDVHYAEDVLPEFGAVRGKGENLWKSLYLASGDIIIWLDTDIQNMHPRFVYGLVGPLLFHPEVGFVKGFYRRPLKVGRKLHPAGGGRVTEILVKPFFNLLFPQLTVFQQPLSGEYGGRRELLERVPFFTGYGVETGLLIDIENRFGLNRMAQVNLEVRIHRNQELPALRKMAFGILKVLFHRASQQGKLVLMDDLYQQLINIYSATAHRFHLELQPVVEIERPPMILVEAYQQRRGLDEEALALVQEIQKQRAVSPVPLGTFLDKNLVVLEGEAMDKESLFMEIATIFTERGIVPHRSQLLHQFYRREASIPTGIGAGVAIPHAIYDDVKQMRILIYRARQGISFNALDGAPVHLVFAVVAPTARRRQYLNVLSSLATLLQDARIRQLLLKATSAEEIVQILRKAEVVKRFEHELRLIEE